MGEHERSSDSCGDGGDSKFQIVENSPQETNPIRIESAETSIDWISKLPDSLIAQILSLLTFTEAFRTTILSKRWQYLWTFIDKIEFYWDVTLRQRHLKKKKVKDFISFIDNVMHLHNRSNIRRFHLSVPDLYVPICSKTDKWLEIALSKKVKNLYLQVWDYKLPQVLCNSGFLLKLHCKYCILSDDCVFNWTSLKSLTLEYMIIPDEQFKKIASSCPQLESLELRDFCGLSRLHLTSPKCRRLQLTDHRHRWVGEYPFGDDRDCFIEIVAPYVHHLKISGDFNCMKIRLGNMSSLVHADLDFEWNNYAYEREINDFKDLLTSLPCVSELTVPSWFIEVISKWMLEEKDFLLPLLECKHLIINSWFTKCSFLGIVRFLRSTPYLKNLMILPDADRDYSAVQLIHDDADYWEEDVYFSGDHFLSLQKDTVKGSLQSLKNAYVILVDCKIRRGIDDSTGLARFLKALLENAINLKELVIGQNHWRCNTCSTRISEMMENLIAFPKASGSTVISLGCESDFVDDEDVDMC